MKKFQFNVVLTDSMVTNIKEHEDKETKRHEIIHHSNC